MNLRNIGMAVCGILLVAIVGLYLYLTPERLRAIIVPELEATLDRQISLGEVNLNLWGGISASLHDLQVGSREGFGPAPFVETQSGELSISLLALLTGGDEIGELAIQNPTIRITIDESGTANYADLLSSETSTERSESPPVLPITRFRIVDGALIQVDRQLGTTLRISDLDYDVDLSLSNAQLGLDGKVQLGAFSNEDAAGTLSEVSNIAVTHELVLAPAQDRLDITRMTLEQGPLGVSVSGSVTALSSPAPHLDVRIREKASSIDWGEDPHLSRVVSTSTSL